MNIHIYLDDEDETNITSFSNLQSDPFKINDELNLHVQDFHASIKGFNKVTQQKFLTLNKKLEVKFDNTKIRLTTRRIDVRFNAYNKSIIEIEYHAVLID